MGWNIANSSLLPETGNVHCIASARQYKIARLLPIDSAIDRVREGCKSIKYSQHKKSAKGKLLTDRERVARDQRNKY